MFGFWKSRSSPKLRMAAVFVTYAVAAAVKIGLRKAYLWEELDMEDSVLRAVGFEGIALLVIALMYVMVFDLQGGWHHAVSTTAPHPHSWRHRAHDALTSFRTRLDHVFDRDGMYRGRETVRRAIEADKRAGEEKNKADGNGGGLRLSEVVALIRPDQGVNVGFRVGWAVVLMAALPIIAVGAVDVGFRLSQEAPLWARVGYVASRLPAELLLYLVVASAIAVFMVGPMLVYVRARDIDRDCSSRSVDEALSLPAGKTLVEISSLYRVLDLLNEQLYLGTAAVSFVLFTTYMVFFALLVLSESDFEMGLVVVVVVTICLGVVLLPFAVATAAIDGIRDTLHREQGRLMAWVLSSGDEDEEQRKALADVVMLHRFVAGYGGGAEFGNVRVTYALIKGVVVAAGSALLSAVVTQRLDR